MDPGFGRGPEPPRRPDSPFARAAFGGASPERLTPTFSTLPEGLSRKNLRSALSTLDPGAGGIVLALGSLGKAWDLQDREADAIEERMKRVLEANAPALLAIYGCGAVSAAALAAAGGGIPKG